MLSAFGVYGRRGMKYPAKTRARMITAMMKVHIGKSTISPHSTTLAAGVVAVPVLMSASRAIAPDSVSDAPRLAVKSMATGHHPR